MDLQLTLSNGIPTINSLQLVDIINQNRREESEKNGTKYVELEHKNFMVKVPEVLGEKQSAKFLADYTDSRNRSQRCYVFPEKEACLMAMSYSYALQRSVYDSWQKAVDTLRRIEREKNLDQVIAEQMYVDNQKDATRAASARTKKEGGDYAGRNDRLNVAYTGRTAKQNKELYEKKFGKKPKSGFDATRELDPVASLQTGADNYYYGTTSFPEDFITDKIANSRGVFELDFAARGGALLNYTPKQTLVVKEKKVLKGLKRKNEIK